MDEPLRIPVIVISWTPVSEVSYLIERARTNPIFAEDGILKPAPKTEGKG